MDLIWCRGLSIRCSRLRCQRTGEKSEGANREEKAPRSKLQTPKKIQAPRSGLARFPNVFGTLDSVPRSIAKPFLTSVFWDLQFESFLGFGVWDLDLLWLLDLGSWILEVAFHTSTSLITSPCTSVNRRS